MSLVTGLCRLAGGFALGAGAFTASAGMVLFITHPAAAAAALAAVQSAVTCASSGTTPCVSGTNTSSGIGVLGTSKTGTGIRGSSNTNLGVKGTSKSGFGVLGQTSSGPAGVAGMSGSSGVLGEGTSVGIDGASTGNGGFGVLGTAPTGAGAARGIGVLAQSNTGPGLVSQSETGTGIDVFSESGVGLFTSTAATAAGPIALFADGGVSLEGISDSFPLRLTDTTGKILFSVDGSGNVQYAGALTGSALTAGGATLTAFTPHQSQPTVEDSGTAQLVSGSALVRLDPTFAAAIDVRAGYRVFLTPNGDTHGLFIAETSPSGFLVRETQGGRATVSFDYRILATATGQAGRRMAAVPLGALRVALPVEPAFKAAALPAPLPLP